MFLGVSKNIGGFRIGVGTRLSGKNKGPTNSEIKSAEFSEFMNKVQDEITRAVKIFVEANGYNFNELLEEKADLNDVFAGNEDYNEFISIFEDSQLKIEKVLFSGDTGVVAKRTITDELFKIKEFISKKYPGFTPSVTPAPSLPLKRRVGLLLGLGIFFVPFVFSWFTLRKGHTKVARVVAFSWLVIALLIAAAPVQEPNNAAITKENTPTSAE